MIAAAAAAPAAAPAAATGAAASDAPPAVLSAAWLQGEADEADDTASTENVDAQVSAVKSKLNCVQLSAYLWSRRRSEPVALEALVVPGASALAVEASFIPAHAAPPIRAHAVTRTGRPALRSSDTAYGNSNMTPSPSSRRPSANHGMLSSRQWQDIRRAARTSRDMGVTLVVHGVKVSRDNLPLLAKESGQPGQRRKQQEETAPSHGASGARQPAETAGAPAGAATNELLNGADGAQPMETTGWHWGCTQSQEAAARCSSPRGVPRVEAC